MQRQAKRMVSSARFFALLVFAGVGILAPAAFAAAGSESPGHPVAVEQKAESTQTPLGGGIADQPTAPAETTAAPVPMEPPVAPESGVEDGAQEAASDPAEKAENPKIHKRKNYIPPTMQNLSKLYWALGLFDVEKDDQAIDNYIMINECQIYRDYYTDDFEWKNVREMTRELLSKRAKGFPRLFEFIQPIELGRYTEETQTFEVLTELITRGSRIFHNEYNRNNQKVCDKKGDVEGYPRNVIVSLSRPVHYPQIPVNLDVAKDYISRTKIGNEEEFRNFPEHLQFLRHSKYQRLAFIVIKVRMIKFIEMRTTSSGAFPVIFSALEGVEVYEDPLKKRLLYSSLSRTKQGEAPAREE